MKTVLYSCAFVPCEWIAAHRLQPMRITPASAGAALTEGLCAYVHAFVRLACAGEADAVVVTTVCDQMRRAGDLIALSCNTPVFVMNVPSTWQDESARLLYIDELKRLGRFLTQLGGNRPGKDHLSDVMTEYEQKRGRSGRRRSVASADGIPLALLGGELLREDLEIFDLVESFGGRIVLDATDIGDRGIPGAFDHRRMLSDPLGELANAYFGTIPHAFRRPDSQLYRYLEKHLTARNVRGIIFRRYPWCDIWNAEFMRLCEWTSIPVLDLESRGEGSDMARLTRGIQAFIEVLR